MSSAGSLDIWASGAAYEPFVGRWSKLVARQFLAWLNIAPGRRWLDVGCGTGILTRTVLEVAAPREVVGIDPSEGFLAFARRETSDARAQFRPADAQNLPFEADSFDVVTSGLVLNFVPDPARAVREMLRVTRPGGTVAAYVWDYADQMQMLRYFWDAAVELDPAASDLDEGRRFPICQPQVLEALFSAAGLEDVELRPEKVPTTFRDFDDYWSPFLGGQGPAPSYVSALDEDCRQALRERLRAALLVAADGSIQLVARAWAVRGSKS
jgi:SAM-dependent methyltransferase